jgi:hypothetical protein
MPFKIDYVYNNKVENPPTFEEFASAYVPTEDELSRAPDARTKTILQMYNEGFIEYKEKYVEGLVETQLSPDGKTVIQVWESEEAYNNFLNVRNNYENSDLSQNIKVFLRIRQQYFAEYFGNADVVTTNI